MATTTKTPETQRYYDQPRTTKHTIYDATELAANQRADEWLRTRCPQPFGTYRNVGYPTRHGWRITVYVVRHEPPYDPPRYSYDASHYTRYILSDRWGPLGEGLPLRRGGVA